MAGSHCQSSQLSLAVGHTGAAAGSFYAAITLTNTGSASCTLEGWPGVSFTDAGGRQIGLAAKRNTTFKEQLVTLAPGEKASAQLQEPNPGNYQQSDCQPARAQQLVVYPPNDFAALSTTYHVTICTTSQGRTMIGTMQPGGNPNG